MCLFGQVANEEFLRIISIMFLVWLTLEALTVAIAMEKVALAEVARVSES